jgi:hypothetical protein
MTHPNNRVYFLPYYNLLEDFWNKYFYESEEVNLNDYLYTRRIDANRRLSGWTDSRGIDTKFNWKLISVEFKCFDIPTEIQIFSDTEKV